MIDEDLDLDVEQADDESVDEAIEAAEVDEPADVDEPANVVESEQAETLEETSDAVVSPQEAADDTV